MKTKKIAAHECGDGCDLRCDMNIQPHTCNPGRKVKGGAVCVECAGFVSDDKPHHTPTPWSLGISRKCDGYAKGKVFQADTDEDAAFIVRAVNCHYELLTAVKELQCFCNQPAFDPGQCSRCCLIAKAERK